MGAGLDDELLRDLAGGERSGPVQPVDNLCQPRPGNRGVVQLAERVLDPRRVLGELPRLLAGGRRDRFGGVANPLGQDSNGVQLGGCRVAVEPTDGAI